MKVLALTLFLLGQDLPVYVQIETEDGNVVIGSTETGRFKLKTSLGTVTVLLKDVKTVQINEDRAVVTATDGTTLRGTFTLNPIKVKSKLGEFTIKPADIRLITIKGVFRPKPPPRPRRGSAPRRPSKPVPKYTPPPVVRGLTPVKVLNLDASIPRTLRSLDGKKIYAINATKRALLIIDLDTFAVEEEITLPGGETSLSIAPSGKFLLAGEKRKITVVSLDKMKVVKTFAVEEEFRDLCVIDDRTVMASRKRSGLLTISIPKQAITYRVGVGSYWRLLLSSDHQRIYTGKGMILLPSEDLERGRPIPISARSSAIELIMSPDRRYGVVPLGLVYRLGKSHVASMLLVGRVSPNWSCAWAPARKRLYVFTSTSFVEEYDSESFQLEKSWFLGHRLSEAHLDESGTVLYGYGTKGPGIPHRGAEQPMRLGNRTPRGNFYKFELPE